MTFVSLDSKSGSELAEGLVYGRARLSGAMTALTMDLFLPGKTRRPSPLLVWLGADILTSKTSKPAGNRVLAGWLTREGVAMAVPSVRSKAQRSDVPDMVIETLPDIEAHRDGTVPPELSSFSALAVTSDICALLRWVEAEGLDYGLSGKVVLAGSSAGAAMAFNAAVVAPHLGLDRPEPAGVISYTGSCAWPGLYAKGRLRTLALHNPSDRRVGIGPVRKMAQNDPAFELYECIEQAHGSLGFWPQEAPQDACNRILARVRRWCG